MSKSSSWSLMPRASTVRTLCLLVISLGLLMLYVAVYVEQQCNGNRVISGRPRDQQDVATATRDVIVNSSVTSSRRQRAPDGYDSAPPSAPAEASWDYNWDSYVWTINIICYTIKLIIHYCD